MLDTITLGGGCFWCLEAVFQQVRGIQKVSSGYMGGHTLSPTYQQICQGDTGHAEVVQLQFDSAEVSLVEILDVFFAIHDPTTLNRQGHDVGTQYRSAIFASHTTQLEAVKSKLLELQREFVNPIVTELLLASTFWPAEMEHHNYYNNYPLQPYCRAVVAPKLQKLMTHFPNMTK
ncbi:MULTISPECIES: peptide-methionine (S)-S-oxide reductase MsrA [Deefgea]|uniref:Peptide methionine sulfoxide reductase MsrA n=1 Tax=Deefgea chitinilytica TaxID=570276 RepID=A0ABS2CB84_9NEIS|nr:MULTISPECIES: peptide-methionine (S)-S-oxide reductase MsrA [Deefgea]MBM5570713.1 peptide-methionine (S)-S-oxide reductase MsrA [Deefgea chitinilytica]MBM9887942.1 peptide-methionine (S)-S-oxide reductase MsrA [Deefgea sp. CFH1-16]